MAIAVSRPELASEAPSANHLDKVGSRGRVLRVWQTAYLPAVGKHIQYMQFGKTGLRPLVWLHSVDYPMAPPWGLCVDAAEQGLGVISVRRPGFGETGAASDTDEEVRILEAFFQEAGLENVVLIVEGTARPVGLKLALGNPRIAYTIFARPAFSSGDFGDIDPWMRDLILQTLQTRAGASLSMAALSQINRRTGHAWLYENFLKVESDAGFVRSNGIDLTEAWNCLSAISADTFRRNLAALAPDPTLVPDVLAGVRGLAVIGANTPAAWRDVFQDTCSKLGIASAFLPSGSLFAAYQNGDTLLKLIAEYA